MDQAGKGDQPAEQVVEFLVAFDRRGKQAAAIGRFGKRGELSLIGLLEGETFGIGAIEIALDLRIVDPGIEIGQIPYGNRPSTDFAVDLALRGAWGRAGMRFAVRPEGRGR